jgi:hypothetical protein
MNKATLMAKLDRLLALLAAPYMPPDTSDGSGQNGQAAGNPKPPVTLVNECLLDRLMTWGPCHRKVPPF